MNKAFVDTTIITDCLLKTGEEQAKAKNALEKYEITELPEYAIREFQARPLSYYCWAHNSLLVTGSIEGAFKNLTGSPVAKKKILDSNSARGIRQSAA